MASSPLPWQSTFKLAAKGTGVAPISSAAPECRLVLGRADAERQGEFFKFAESELLPALLQQ